MGDAATQQSHIIGFEGSWPQEVPVTWGSAAIQLGERIYNSVSGKDKWIHTSEMPHDAITVFPDPVPFEGIQPLWVVSMDLTSKWFFSPEAYEDQEMVIPPRVMEIQKDLFSQEPSEVSPKTQARFIFLSPDQFKNWRTQVVQRGLEKATTSLEADILLGLAPKNMNVHVKRWLLSDRKDRVKITARGMLSSQDFAMYQKRIGQ